MTMENSDEVSFQERTSSDNSFIDEIHLIFKKGEWGGYTYNSYGLYIEMLKLEKSMFFRFCFLNKIHDCISPWV